MDNVGFIELGQNPGEARCFDFLQGIPVRWDVWSAPFVGGSEELIVLQHNNAALCLGVLAEQREDIANAGVDIVWGQVDEMGGNGRYQFCQVGCLPI